VVVTLDVGPQLRVRWIRADGSPDPNQPDTGRVVTPASAHPYRPTTMSDGQSGIYLGWADELDGPTGTSNVILSWVPYDPDDLLLGVGSMPHAGALPLRAWPNSARDALEVELAPAFGSRARLELLDVTGRRVRSLEVHGSQVARLKNLRDLAPGVYLLRVQQGNAIRTARVALMH
jgi:hypothetical protein